jgi:WD40 repeat protein
MKRSVFLLFSLLLVALICGCASGGPALTITTPNNASAVIWSPDGGEVIANGFREVSAASEEGSIGIWSLASNEQVESLITADDPNKYNYVSLLSINPTRTQLLITAPYRPALSNGFVAVYDVKQNTLTTTWEGLYLDDDTSKTQETIQAALFSPDGSVYAVAGSFYIRIIDSASNSETMRIAVNARGGAVNSGDERLKVNIAWSPYGSRLAWTVLDNLSYYDIATSSVTVLKDSQTGMIPSPNEKIAWSPDGSSIAYEKDKGLHIINVADDSLTTTIGVKGEYAANHVKRIQYSPDGSMVMLCTLEYVGVWKLADGSLVFEQAITDPVNEFDRFEDAAWSPDGKKLAIISYGDKQILIYSFGE